MYDTFRRSYNLVGEDTCIKEIYRHILNKTEERAIELIGLPQFLDPSTDLIPPDFVNKELYQFKDDIINPFGNFNKLCKPRSSDGLFDTNMTCMLTYKDEILITDYGLKIF